MRRVVLFALALLSCHHRGEGTNIAEFGNCVTGPNRTSVCAAGLFCDTSKGFLEREGNTYVRHGNCIKSKDVGDVCYSNIEGMCRAPAMCVEDTSWNNGTRGAYEGRCRQNP